MIADMRTAETITHYRKLRGWSYAELADAAGMTERQVRRYEDPEKPAMPSLPAAYALSQALGISMRTLSGHGVPVIDVTELRFSAWQTWMDDVERVEVEALRIIQEDSFLQVTGAADPTHLDTGSYGWTGEWRLLRDRCITGWYAATDAAIISNGTVHITLHEHGHYAIGRWMGLSHDGINECGFGAVAATEDLAVKALDAIRDTRGTLKRWPDLSGIEFPGRTE